MTMDEEFFNVKYKEGSLEAKTAQLIFFAVNLDRPRDGAKLHLEGARESARQEDEIMGAVVYAMRPAAAKVRNFAKAIIAKYFVPNVPMKRVRKNEPVDDRR